MPVSVGGKRPFRAGTSAVYEDATARLGSFVLPVLLDLCVQCAQYTKDTYFLTNNGGTKTAIAAIDQYSGK